MSDSNLLAAECGKVAAVVGCEDGKAKGEHAGPAAFFEWRHASKASGERSAAEAASSIEAREHENVRTALVENVRLCEWPAASKEAKERRHVEGDHERRRKDAAPAARVG